MIQYTKQRLFAELPSLPITVPFLCSTHRKLIAAPCAWIDENSPWSGQIRVGKKRRGGEKWNRLAMRCDVELVFGLTEVLVDRRSAFNRSLPTASRYRSHCVVRIAITSGERSVLEAGSSS